MLTALEIAKSPAHAAPGESVEAQSPPRGRGAAVAWVTEGRARVCARGAAMGGDGGGGRVRRGSWSRCCGSRSEKAQLASGLKFADSRLDGVGSDRDPRNTAAIGVRGSTSLHRSIS
jgi:hypothetical protein